VSDHLEEPIVNQIMQTYKGGKACVLTQTNEEALRVLGVLLKKGMRAKLIQSMDGFRLYNLAEIRFFLKQIDKQLQTPIISDEIWNKAKAQLKRTYQDSACLEVCLNLIADFEQVNSYTKYRTDLEEFIKESNYEDFYTDDLETIYVSTIHKSKGREFENVYMLLNHFSVNSDAERRKLYVGMTRAKNSLYIHCNSNLFAPYNVPNVEKLEDSKEYPEPEEISMQLTHKDVVLDFFKDKKEIIFKLHSGAKLNLKNGFLSAEIDDRTVRVAKLSKACVEKVEYLESKGYIPFSADVRFVVAWKGEDDEQETAVLLPNIYLKK
jgi:ATP-dependent DNA helicase RecQ